MNKFDQLAKIILAEAPLSSYVKKVVSPSAYIRGAGKVLQGASQATGGLTTSTKSLASTLGTAANIAAKVGGQPSPPKEKESKKQTIPTSKQTQTQDIPSDLSKVKTQFVINNTQIPAKYMGDIKAGYPTFRIQGIPWAKSIVLELTGKGKASVYFFADKKPNTKKNPAVIRPGTLSFQGLQNKLTVTTK
jgi:hypothetical protein